jgi:hypothetical protein
MSKRDTIARPVVGFMAAGLACGLLGLAGCSSEQQGASYKSFAMAQTAGAVHAGWIPEWLPKTSFNLKEKHDGEAKASILRFDFVGAEKWAPPGTCVGASPAQVRKPAVTASWWPQDVPAASGTTGRHAYYACVGEREFLAVDFSRGEAFHWRP